MTMAPYPRARAFFPGFHDDEDALHGEVWASLDRPRAAHRSRARSCGDWIWANDDSSAGESNEVVADTSQIPTSTSRAFHISARGA